MAKADDAAIIAEARQRWAHCDEAEDAQRKAILLAKQFRAGDQWPTAIKIARQGQHAIAGLPAMPPRPCLVVDRLSQPVRQISNIIKSASFGFDVLPNGAGADTETAEIFKGYMRRVQAQSRGESPVEWAADGAIEGGIGWFRMRTDYVHQTWDGDPNDPAIFDQEVVLERITNNLSVYCDPSALKPTRSDSQYFFVTEDVSRDEFTRRWPKADYRGLEAFMATGDQTGWVSEDTIRIAEYWRITYTNRRFESDAQGNIREVGAKKTEAAVTDAPDQPATSDSQADDQPADQTPHTRIMRVAQVEGYKITACEVLERWTWAGSKIPIIPILGEELNVDGKPVLRGVITEGMDAQRMVNYTYSGAMEIFALASKSPWIAAVGQIEAYKDIWQTANVYNHAYLPYDPITIAGTVVGAPQRDDSEPPIQAAVALMRTSEEAIKATTSTGDASLGNSNPNERSGKALQALQQQSELANSNYPDNVRRALIYCAELMVEVIPKITRKGQILSLMGQDDEPTQVMVGQPFQPGATPGQPPQAAPPGVTPEMTKLQGAIHKFFDLNQGKYAVTVSVGKAVATRREEGAAALGQLIPHLPPEMAAVATPDYVEQLSFPGAHKIAEKLRKALPPQLQEPDPKAPPIDPQVQQQLQGLQQELQKAQQAIQTDQAKQQASIQIAQLKAQADAQMAQLEAQKEIHLQEMKNANAIAVARIGAAKSAMDTAAEAQEERLSTGIELQHDAQQAAADRAHEVGMAAMQHDHAQQIQAGAQQHAADSQQTDIAAQQQAAEQVAQQQPMQDGSGNA